MVSDGAAFYLVNSVLMFTVKLWRVWHYALGDYTQIWCRYWNNTGDRRRVFNGQEEVRACVVTAIGYFRLILITLNLIPGSHVWVINSDQMLVLNITYSVLFWPYTSVHYILRRRYNAVNFLIDIPKRHPIALGRLLWILHLLDILHYILRRRYNAVNFLIDIPKRHTIALGRLLWILHLLDILPEFLQWFVQYLTIFALDCMYIRSLKQLILLLERADVTPSPDLEEETPSDSKYLQRERKKQICIRSSDTMNTRTILHSQKW